MWHLRTFGGLAIGPGRGAPAVEARRRPLALLAVLAIAGERGCGREKIVALLWPESDEDHGRNSLSQALGALRRGLSAPDPVLGAAELRLNPSAITSDVSEFERSIASGALERAVATYQGPFLDGFFLRDADDLERWAAGHRRRLHDMHVAALERLARNAEERSEHEVALSWWRRLTALEPTSAPAVSGLMRVLAAMGDRAGALRQYRDHEQMVRQEFGVAPGTAIAALAASLLSEQGTASAATVLTNSGRGRPEGPFDRSVAVMPLANLSADKANDYFGEGLAGEMTNALRIAGLRVIGPGNTRALAARELDARSIGDHLGVANVLQGTVQRNGDRLRITMGLVAASDGALVWGEKYDRHIRDVFALQDEIAHNVAAQLRVTLAGGTATTLVRKETADPEAHALYFQGLYQWNRRTAQTLHLAVALFQQALRRDPNYARAYAGICMAYIVLPVYTDVPTDETRSLAVDAAHRALAIDSTLAEAHAVLGLAHAYVFENALAERSFAEALRLDPHCATARFWHALLLGHLGRHDEAIREVRLAHALEPASLAIQNGIVEELFYARRYAEADGVSRAIMTLDSTFQLGLIFRARVLIELRDFDEAIAILERLSQAPSIRSAEKLGMLAYAYARAGDAASARATLARLSQDPLLSTSGEIATALDLLGDRDAAVAMFRRAVAQHDQRITAGSRSEPYDRLRRDRRLSALFAKIEAVT
jgi:DNA-binding SARP family transcriptional activator/tetratricopeptide (TPR) repeat protein